ncbi:MAG: biotin/lipoyl-binding protein [Planctomycetaceae bacterium]
MRTQTDPDIGDSSPTVTVAQPVVENFADFAEFTGSTEAEKRVDIQARVSGYLEKINFLDGGKVNEGDVLFVIDPRPYQAAYDAAKAQVSQWEASVKKPRPT